MGALQPLWDVLVDLQALLHLCMSFDLKLWMGLIVQVLLVLQDLSPALLQVAVQDVTTQAILGVLEDVENHCFTDF